MPASSLVLGSYHLGEYYSETTFNYNSILYKEFNSDLELQTCLTAYHEYIHLLQDLGTGFGCFLSEVKRELNESIIFKLREWNQNDSIKIPLITHLNELKESKNRELAKGCYSDYNNYNLAINLISDKDFISKSNLPHFKKLDYTQPIGFIELFEGITTLYSHYFCLENNKYADFISKRLKYFPEPYTSTLKIFYQNILPKYEGIPIGDKLGLLFLLSDFSLHIPPPSTFSHENLHEFIPGFRFYYALNAIIDLDLSFPDSTIDGYTDFVNNICNYPELKWHPLSTVTDEWINHLESQKNIANKDLSIDWKLSLMKMRKKNPLLFSSYQQITATLLGCKGEIPFIGKTKSHNWVYLSGDDIGKAYNDATFIIMFKVFLNNIIQQIMESGLLWCPLPKFLAKCDHEIEECNSNINPKKNLYSNKCWYSNIFNEVFLLDFSILQPDNKYNSSRIRKKEDQSLDEVIDELIRNSINDNIDMAYDAMKKLKTNELYNFLKNFDSFTSDLLPVFPSDNSLCVIIDARWTDIKLLYAKAQLCIDKNELEEAIKYLNTMTEENPTNWLGWYTLGQQLNKLNQDKKAFEIFGESLKNNPADFQTWCNLGYSLAKLKKWKQAIIFFNEAIEIEPKDYITLVDLGTAYRELKEFDKSLFYLGEAINLSPDKPEAYISLKLTNLSMHSS